MFLWLFAATLPGCEQGYSQWVDDFLDEHSHIEFEQVGGIGSSQHLHPDGILGGSLRDRMLACEPLHIAGSGAVDQYDCSGGGRCWEVETREYFVVPREDGGCDLHAFAVHSISKNAGPIGCDSSSSEATYTICYGGLDGDCQVVEDTGS